MTFFLIRQGKLKFNLFCVQIEFPTAPFNVFVIDMFAVFHQTLTLQTV